MTLDRANRLKLAPADPAPSTHPFRVCITCCKKDVVNILQDGKPGPAGGSKDY